MWTREHTECGPRFCSIGLEGAHFSGNGPDGVGRSLIELYDDVGLSGRDNEYRSTRGRHHKLDVEVWVDRFKITAVAKVLN